MTQRVAIIPARGGSKRIPRKNIRLFCGFPVIAYPIRLAKSSGLFQRIIVSTDDAEVASIALEYGAEVPFRRPVELADDFSGTDAVIAHALRVLADDGFCPEEVCCLYPTTPLLTADILQGSHALLGPDVGLVMTGMTYSSPIQRAYRYSSQCGAEYFYPQYAMSRTQDLEPAWYDAGQLYWASPEYFYGQIPAGFRVEIFPLSRLQSQDIDTEQDWMFAEFLYRFANQQA